LNHLWQKSGMVGEACALPDLLMAKSSGFASFHP
jgi:hypothetical protein